MRRAALLLLSTLALATAPAAPSAAATLHVDPQGSDTATGSTGAPFRTIGRAVRDARAGDTVLVRAGRYAEEVSVTGSASGVTLRADRQSGQVVVDGGGTRRFGFFVAGASDLTIEGFEITRQTDAGVYLNGQRNLVTATTIHHVGAAGITHSNGVRVAAGARNRVSGNAIHHIGPGGESMGIFLIETRDALVDGNTVYAVRKEGVRDWKGLDNTISANRILLNWAGIAFNHSTGSVATNNYVYDNVEGLAAKHTSSPSVLAHWGLTQPRWSRFVHNTVYRSTESSVWIAQSDDPLDHLQVANNIFDDAGTAYVRDMPSLRGPNVVVDGNAYAPPAAGRSIWLYKAGWDSRPGLTDWDAYRTATGWEANGRRIDPRLIDPAAGNLDYPESSPAASGSPALDTPLGTQLGARGLPATRVRWTPYPMRAIDSSSKGTWWTEQRLGATADDDQNSYWMTATAQNEFVTYDFGQARTFDHLVVTLFAHWDNRNAHGYRFEVSDDGATWRTVLEGDNPDSMQSSLKYELPAPVTARYLRYTMRDTSCRSYAPRTDCGTQFVLSDVKAGRLTEGPVRKLRTPVAAARPVPTQTAVPTTVRRPSFRRTGAHTDAALPGGRRGGVRVRVRGAGPKRGAYHRRKLRAA